MIPHPCFLKIECFNYLDFKLSSVPIWLFKLNLIEINDSQEDIFSLIKHAQIPTSLPSDHSSLVLVVHLLVECRVIEVVQELNDLALAVDWVVHCALHDKGDTDHATTALPLARDIIAQLLNTTQLPVHLFVKDGLQDLKDASDIE